VQCVFTATTLQIDVDSIAYRAVNITLGWNVCEKCLELTSRQGRDVKTLSNRESGNGVVGVREYGPTVVEHSQVRQAAVNADVIHLTQIAMK